MGVHFSLGSKFQRIKLVAEPTWLIVACGSITKYILLRFVKNRNDAHFSDPIFPIRAALKTEPFLKSFMTSTFLNFVNDVWAGIICCNYNNLLSYCIVTVFPFVISWVGHHLMQYPGLANSKPFRENYKLPTTVRISNSTWCSIDFKGLEWTSLLTIVVSNCAFPFSMLERNDELSIVWYLAHKLMVAVHLEIQNMIRRFLSWPPCDSLLDPQPSNWLRPSR